MDVNATPVITDQPVVQRIHVRFNSIDVVVTVLTTVLRVYVLARMPTSYRVLVIVMRVSLVTMVNCVLRRNVPVVMHLKYATVLQNRRMLISLRYCFMISAKQPIMDWFIMLLIVGPNLIPITCVAMATGNVFSVLFVGSLRT
jgi:hypothetical protein